jgi:predicted TPR repeat methyltransferase
MNRNERRNPRLALARAVEHQRAGQLGEAEALLREALARDAKLAPAAHLLGIVRCQQGDAVEGQRFLERAVLLEPGNVDGWRNLGNVSVEAGAPGRAEECFRRVLRLRPGDVAARGNLALLCEKSGRVDEAIQELRELLRVAPAEDGALRLLARLLRQQKQYEDAVTVGRELTRLRPGDESARKALSRSYFLWFDAVDRDRDQARRVLAEWTAFDAQDPVARHMLAAYTGEAAPDRASDDYVERHFDEFAATFDQVLGSLRYRGPELLEEAVRLADPAPRASHAVADVGCGTGQCGPAVRPWARTLVGVDLSPKMLDRARERGCYDELVHEEATAFLAARPGAFDLVVCADTLVYFGDLGQVFAVAARSLAPGGRFIATLELLESGGRPFELSVAGRYAHEAGYVASVLAGVGLTVERIAPADLRLEHGTFTKGLVVTGRAPLLPA